MPLRIASYYPTPEHQRMNQPWLQAHLSCIKRGGGFPLPWPWVESRSE